MQCEKVEKHGEQVACMTADGGVQLVLQLLAALCSAGASVHADLGVSLD